MFSQKSKYMEAFLPLRIRCGTAAGLIPASAFQRRISAKRGRTQTFCLLSRQFLSYYIMGSMLRAGCPFSVRNATRVSGS